MSRLELFERKTEKTWTELYQGFFRRVAATPPALCPVEMTAAFLNFSHAQSCGKCVPCRIGLKQLELLVRDVLEGRGTEETLQIIEETAESIYYSSDCAIGSEAAGMALKNIRGFRDDFREHMQHGRCRGIQRSPVPCVAECPAHVDVPGYIDLLHVGQYDEAVQLIRKDNPFPAVCGLICEHPCEEHCRRQMVDDPINIRGLKRYAVELEKERKLPEKYPSTGKKIGVIGGGPSGLTAAYYLSIMGHDVTVFEQRKQLGGMLRYGIPSYRLPRETLDKEIAGLKQIGFKTVENVSIGKDIPLQDFCEQYDAVYVSIGAHTDNKLRIEGEDAEGVVSAVQMLRGIGDGEMPDYSGKKVVVVGGGNVAMDVARSAIRLGASSVTIAYRRRKMDMTALPEEVEGAIADGCEVLELHAPVSVETDSENRATALWVQPQIVGPIRGGRPAPVAADADPVRLPCDLILVAIGQKIESAPFEVIGLPLRWDQIAADHTCAIEGHEKIFAGGDCVTGPATVIKAIAAGKTAAANIDEFLGYHHEIKTEIEFSGVPIDDHAPLGRINMRERPAEERRNDFRLMECPMTDQEACQESGRCLHCDHFGFGVLRGGRVTKW